MPQGAICSANQMAHNPSHLALTAASSPASILTASHSVTQRHTKAVDECEISIDEFHQKIAALGVVFVNVFPASRKIYYFGQDGSFFLETF